MPRSARSSFRLLVPLAVLALGCQAVPEEPMKLGARQGPIVNGEPDTNPSHAAVVAVLIGHGGMCSGTLIAPRVVLTAGHCVAGYSARYFRVGFGDVMSQSAMKFVGVSDARAHPRYTEDPAFDIALLRLSGPTPVAVEPVPPLPASLRLTSADVGTSLEFSGFGETETGDTGEKLRVSGPLGFVCDRETHCSWNGMPTSPYTICYNQRPGGPCSGDSGGPAFVWREGTEYVAGVTSYGDQNCSYFGCSTKVDAFDAWIADYVRGTPGTACEGSADCLDGHCIDGLCCESDCDVECASCGEAGLLGTCRPGPSGGACNDADLCTAGDQCKAGRCVGAPAVYCPITDPCQVSASCDPDTGGCVYAPKPDGVVCSTRSLCRSGETCQAGVCTPEIEVKCAEAPVCHVAACNDGTGRCETTQAVDGTACKVGAAEGLCEAGQCKTGCGCTAGGVDAVPALLAVAAVALRRRRRS